LPLAAAIGGVAAPALTYFLVNYRSGLVDGWAVPTATDVAFAVGALALLGRSIPVNVRIFLLTLAIVDDIITDHARQILEAVTKGCLHAADPTGAVR
jgi:NhaA family Na+:H+ antiporter